MRDSADDKIYTFANVIFKEDDEATYCYIADEEIHAGDLAQVLTDEGTKYVLVAYIDRTTADKAPYPFEKLKRIKGRVAKGAPEYDALYKKFLKRRPYVWDEKSGEQTELYDVFSDDGNYDDFPDD